MQHSIDLNLQYSVHNHIKDGYLDEEGRVRYLLPGSGKLDMKAYYKALQDAGWDQYLCPEVTGQIWNADGLRRLEHSAVLLRRAGHCTADIELRADPKNLCDAHKEAPDGSTSHRALLVFSLRCQRASTILRCSKLLEVEQRNLKRLLKPVDSPTIIFLVPNNRFDLMAQHSNVTAS